MLVKITFDGIVPDNHKIADEVIVHAKSLKNGKEIFLRWVNKADGIRGEKCFHPLNGYGDIRIKEVTEVVDATRS